MSLKGIETGAELSLKLTGAIAKNLGAFFYAALTGAKQVKGRASLVQLLKTGKVLKTFSVRTADLELFTCEAKKRGVLFHVLKDPDPFDGMSEIMLPAENANTILAIAERFKLASVHETAQIETEVKESKKAEPVKGTPAEKTPDAFLDGLEENFAGKMEVKDNPAQERPDAANPTRAAKEPHNRSGNSSAKQENGEPDLSKFEQPSVRRELEGIKAEQGAKQPQAPEKALRGKTKPARAKTPHTKKGR